MKFRDLQQFIIENEKVRPNSLSHSHPEKIEEIKQCTSFLPNDAPLRQRYYHIKHNKFTIPLCTNSECNVAVNWNPTSRNYREYCSTKCLANSSMVSSKRENTNIERYGGIAPACDTNVRDKMKSTLTLNYGNLGLTHPTITSKRKKTNLERYNVENPSQNQKVKTKKISTSLKNFGTEHPLQNAEQYQKMTRMMLERYGVYNPACSDVLRSKRDATILERYDCIKVMDNDELREKRENTSISRYGDASFARSKLSDFCRDKINDPSWLTTQHHENKLSIYQISQMLQIDPSSLSKYFDAYNIEKFRYPSSSGEVELGEILTSHGLDITTNDRIILKPKELDIVIPSKRIAIEYCGLYWHSDKHDRITSRTHFNKMKYCNKQGFQLLTIFDDEWINNRDLCIAAILHKCGISKKHTVFARKCKVELTTQKQKVEFFNANHIQGTGPGSLTYHLSYNNDIVAMITFIKKANGVWILNRYATSCNVPGGFSKLLSYFKKNNDWRVIESFADLRWSDGTMYENNGFKLTKQLPPDYRYAINGARCHKFAFRHSSLKTKLPNYNPLLSEVDNMKAHEYYRVWDCGLRKYTMILK